MPTDPSTYFYSFIVFVAIIFILAQPASLEKTNEKRTAKGKPELTPKEYERRIKRDRIIAVAILAAGAIISALIVSR